MKTNSTTCFMTSLQYTIELSVDKFCYLHLITNKLFIDIMSKHKLVLCDNSISRQKNVGGYILEKLSYVIFYSKDNQKI